MLQRLAEILGRGIASVAAQIDRMALPVIGHDVRMINRHDRGLLPEIVYRIAALAHDLGDEPICIRHRAGRIVDEVRLNLSHSRPYLSR